MFFETGGGFMDLSPPPPGQKVFDLGLTPRGVLHTKNKEKHTKKKTNKDKQRKTKKNNETKNKEKQRQTNKNKEKQRKTKKNKEK